MILKPNNVVLTLNVITPDYELLLIQHFCDLFESDFFYISCNDSTSARWGIRVTTHNKEVLIGIHLKFRNERIEEKQPGGDFFDKH